jgi:hypothetical protein
MVAMRASALRFLSASLSFTVRPEIWVGAAIASAALFGCTLITDVDREKIPQPVQPTFPEVDSGPGPEQPIVDAAVPDAAVDGGDALDAGALDADTPVDAGDGGADAG